MGYKNRRKRLKKEAGSRRPPVARVPARAVGVQSGRMSSQQENRVNGPRPDVLLVDDMPQGRSPLDRSLDWQQQRVKWNREGYCAREACGQRHADMVHVTTNLAYCRPCARKLNEAQGVGTVMPREMKDFLTEDSR